MRISEENRDRFEEGKGEKNMQNNNDLKEIFKEPVAFTMKWEPEAGMTIERHGSPASISVLAEFALMHALIGTLKPEKQTPDGVFKTLQKALAMAHAMYKFADITTIDLNEMGKQAQDADQ